MFYAHTVPEGDAESVFDGRSSILFATIAGVSLGLMTGGQGGPAPGTRWRAARIVAIRGALLIVLGVALTLLDTPIAIILDTYGFLFLVAIPLLVAPRWVLAVVAAAAAFGGPWLVETLTAAVDTEAALPVSSVANPFLYFPSRWILGTYPAPVWLAYIALGLLIARCGVDLRRTQLLLLTLGAVVALAGYTTATALGEPVSAHDDSTFEVISSGAVAVAVIGLFTALTESTGRRMRTAVTRILQPLWATGSMPLTVYSAQIVALWWYVENYDSEEWLAWQSVPLFVAFAVTTLVVCSLYRLVFRQGPLEWLVARISTQRPWRRAPRDRDDERPVASRS
ncbi:DUF418 domain-containing protein [Herbiconiux sp. KACC 21604]|uniref:DUF418 domain-containing protein n=1 Tax=unclassified Herbiconiux TaxID=2618217 RepID=UPI001492669E|nr:DUF418 domain-containing protein [Herbiconiux sp. SALV-R1]QJU52458.1 DUF418 domain-containing protein [Herbiconiux sp. SALV-R1]WPO87328.1 DUF418 domain-containing protein [Herbiconiux sp. KACC 21604]